jgi:hypothetical protein
VQRDVARRRILDQDQEQVRRRLDLRRQHLGGAEGDRLFSAVVVRRSHALAVPRGIFTHCEP